MIRIAASFSDYQAELLAEGNFTERWDSDQCSVVSMSSSPDFSAHKLAECCQANSNPDFGSLTGNFAFIIHDKSAARLLAAPDFFATKALYYYWQNGLFLIDSDLASLVKRVPAVSINTDRLAQYLSADGDDEDIDNATFYNEIHTIRPAHYLQVTGSKIEEKPYWGLSPGDMHLTDAGWAAAFRQALLAAYQRHVRPHVPSSANLSGGLDSSTMVGLHQHLGFRPLTTFYVDTHAAGAQEQPYARAVAEQWHTQHTWLTATPPTYSQLKETTARLGQPDPLVLPAAVLENIIRHSKQAGSEQLISGHGGDNVVGFGHLYLDLLIEQRQWPELGQALQAYEALRPGNKALRKEVIFSALKGLVKKKDITGALSWLWVSSVHLHFNWPAALFTHAISRKKTYHWPSLAWQPQYLPKNRFTLPTRRPLSKAEKFALQSMYVGLGIRGHAALSALSQQWGVLHVYPFFDKDLFLLSMQVPERLRFGNGRLRGILRDATEGILPEMVRSRLSKGEFSDFAVRTFANAYTGFRKENPAESPIWQHIDKNVFDDLANLVLSQKLPRNQQSAYSFLGLRVMNLACWIAQVHAANKWKL